MLLEIINKFNWVDYIVTILIFLRIIWMGAVEGLVIEFFKFLGTIAATYAALHYFTFLSDLISRVIPHTKEATPIEFIDFICFTALAIIAYLIFVALRIVFYRFLKMEALPTLSKWGGFILGILRGALLVSLIIFMLVISSIGYLKTSCARSYSGKTLFSITPKVYSWLWNNIAHKFIPGEKHNDTIQEIQEDFMQS